MLGSEYPSVNKSKRVDDSKEIVFRRVLIFRYPYSELSIGVGKFTARFQSKRQSQPSNRPDGVINAENILARSVISTTQNPFAISKESTIWLYPYPAASS